MAQCSLVEKVEQDVELKIPAKKYFNMIAGTPQDIPKATADNIQRCDVIQGESGKVGSILFWNFIMDGKPNVLKERIEALEPEKNLISLRVIEGDMMKMFNSLLITVQATPKQGGTGSVVKCVLTYERINEKVSPPNSLLDVFAKATKDIDAMFSSQV